MEYKRNVYPSIRTNILQQLYYILSASSRVLSFPNTRGRDNDADVHVSEDQECRKPPFVHHAEHTGGAQDRFPLGTMLKYHCKEDFSAPGGSIDTAWCVGGGVWVGPNMTCARKYFCIFFSKQIRYMYTKNEKFPA